MPNGRRTLAISEAGTAQFRGAEAQIRQAEQGIAIGIKLGEQPCCRAQRVEEFDDRSRVRLGLLGSRRRAG
jgi:hypothetical protein